LEQYDPIPHDFNLFNRGRVEIIKQSIRDFITFYKIIGAEFNDINMIYNSIALMNQLPGQPHIGMFMRCIDFMGSEDQKK
jgi:hypothetical protein